MKNTKKSLLLIAIVLTALMLTGCNKTKKLEKAFKTLNETSYTINAEMTVSVSSNNQSYTNKMNMYYENDPTQSYSITKYSEGEYYSYCKLTEQGASVYMAFNKTDWTHLYDLTMEEYNKQNLEVGKVEDAEYFKYENGVYVGDTEALNDTLNDYINSLVKEYIDVGLEIKLFNIKKYNVILEKNNVSQVEIDFEISLGGLGQTVSTSYSMILNFSKIGETQVTVPSIANK